MTVFLAGMAFLLITLTILAAMADWIDGAERRDSRRRNR